MAGFVINKTTTITVDTAALRVLQRINTASAMQEGAGSIYI